MLEKDFTTIFLRFLKHHDFPSGAYELKITNKQSISFSSVKQHQELALFFAKNKSIFYKIPDDTFSQKPFDVFSLNKVSSYVVICFHKPRKSRFVLIDIEAFMNEKKTSSRKSLTEKRAQEIGTFYEIA